MILPSGFPDYGPRFPGCRSPWLRGDACPAATESCAARNKKRRTSPGVENALRYDSPSGNHDGGADEIGTRRRDLIELSHSSAEAHLTTGEQRIQCFAVVVHGICEQGEWRRFGFVWCAPDRAKSHPGERHQSRPTQQSASRCRPDMKIYRFISHNIPPAPASINRLTDL